MSGETWTSKQRGRRPPRCATRRPRRLTGVASPRAWSISERSSTRTVRELEILERAADVASGRARRARAPGRSRATSAPCGRRRAAATGARSNASLAAASSGRRSVGRRSTATARRSASAQRRAVDLREDAPFRSSGAKGSYCVQQQLRLAEEEDSRASPQREVEAASRIRPCVSGSKYISVLRQTSRSTREIGGSWTQVVAAEDRPSGGGRCGTRAGRRRLEVALAKIGGTASSSFGE